MSFRNVPPDLTLPPGGSLTPGSGTIYIGSQQLPPAMSQFESAIIFYSDPIGLSQGVDYWYLAHFGASHAPFTADGVQIGYHPTGGGLTKSTIGSFFQGGNDNTTIEGNTAGTLAIVQNSTGQILIKTNNGGLLLANSTGQLQLKSAQAMFIESDVAANGAVQFIAPNGNFLFEGVSGGSGPNLQVLGWQGGNAYIKAQNANQDKWYSSSTTQTIGSVSGCTVQFDWRYTADYVIDVRFFISCPSPPGVGAGAVNLNLPASFPAIDLSPGISRGGFTPCIGEGGGFTPMMMRFNNGGTCSLFTCQNPNGNTVFEGGGAFTLLKP